MNRCGLLRSSRRRRRRRVAVGRSVHSAAPHKRTHTLAKSQRHPPVTHRLLLSGFDSGYNTTHSHCSVCVGTTFISPPLQLIPGARMLVTTYTDWSRGGRAPSAGFVGTRLLLPVPSRRCYSEISRIQPSLRNAPSSCSASRPRVR